MDEHARFLRDKLILTNSCSWVVVVVVCPSKTHTKKLGEEMVEFCRSTIYLKTSLRKKKNPNICINPIVDFWWRQEAFLFFVKEDTPW
jgi:hypothetical protein